jgi:superfamily II DNA/RNA helicase
MSCCRNACSCVKHQSVVQRVRLNCGHSIAVYACVVPAIQNATQYLAHIKRDHLHFCTAILHCTHTQQLRGITGDAKALVFVNTKKTADILGRQLEQSGFASAVGVLHGGKSQEQRESALEDFRNGSINVLVATDVASRGLDIPDVGNVINYELPSKIETYCHRIGRTGRAGKDGIATSYITDKVSFYNNFYNNFLPFHYSMCGSCVGVCFCVQRSVQLCSVLTCSTFASSSQAQLST